MATVQAGAEVRAEQGLEMGRKRTELERLTQGDDRVRTAARQMQIRDE